VALPGATTLLHYMLERFGGLVEGLVVRPERMAENIERGLGLHASSRLLTMLIDAGMTRPDAYRVVQRDAIRATDQRAPFRPIVEADADITAVLSAEALARCFDDHAWLTNTDEVIARLERLDP